MALCYFSFDSFTSSKVVQATWAFVVSIKATTPVQHRSTLYMCKTMGELTKNRREDDEGFDGGLIYEKPGPNCPLVSFELYLSHLNPLNELF